MDIHFKIYEIIISFMEEHSSLSADRRLLFEMDMDKIFREADYGMDYRLSMRLFT